MKTQTLVVILSLLGAGLPQELGVEEKGSGIPYSLSSISALVNKVQARVQKVLTGGGQLVGRLADSAREELAEMKTTGVSVAYEGLQSLFKTVADAVETLPNGGSLAKAMKSQLAELHRSANHLKSVIWTDMATKEAVLADLAGQMQETIGRLYEGFTTAMNKSHARWPDVSRSIQSAMLSVRRIANSILRLPSTNPNP